MSKEYAVQPKGLSTMVVEADVMKNNDNGSVELWKDSVLIHVASIENCAYIGLKDAIEIERKR